jgi:hypothetical protein
MIAFLTRTRKRIFLLTVVAVLAICGVAFAAWLTSGTGHGQGKTGTLSTFTVNSGTASQITDPAVPGNPGDAIVIIDNPNGPLAISSIEPGPGSAVTSNPACASSIGVSTTTGLNIPLPSGQSEIKIPNAFTVSADAPTACQGITFTRSIKITASAQ